MNDDELRLLIRTAIQKHIGGRPMSAVEPQEAAPAIARELAPVLSMTFSQYRLERPADDTMCIVEPAVRCNHCGFCKCHGH